MAVIWMVCIHDREDQIMRVSKPLVQYASDFIQCPVRIIISFAIISTIPFEHQYIKYSIIPSWNIPNAESLVFMVDSLGSIICKIHE